LLNTEFAHPFRCARELQVESDNCRFVLFNNIKETRIILTRPISKRAQIRFRAAAVIINPDNRNLIAYLSINKEEVGKLPLNNLKRIPQDKCANEDKDTKTQDKRGILLIHGRDYSTDEGVA